MEESYSYVSEILNKGLDSYFLVSGCVEGYYKLEIESLESSGYLDFSSINIPNFGSGYLIFANNDLSSLFFFLLKFSPLSPLLIKLFCSVYLLKLANNED